MYRDLARLIEALPAKPHRTVQISDELAVKVQGFFGEWGTTEQVAEAA
jgi:hypothetical protein